MTFLAENIFLTINDTELENLALDLYLDQDGDEIDQEDDFYYVFEYGSNINFYV